MLSHVRLVRISFYEHKHYTEFSKCAHMYKVHLLNDMTYQSLSNACHEQCFWGEISTHTHLPNTCWDLTKLLRYINWNNSICRCIYLDVVDVESFLLFLEKVEYIQIYYINGRNLFKWCCFVYCVFLSKLFSSNSNV